jgi:hypothetical protein
MGTAAEKAGAGISRAARAVGGNKPGGTKLGAAAPKRMGPPAPPRSMRKAAPKKKK